MLQLPEQPGPARDGDILTYIRGNQYAVTWASITTAANGHLAEFMVFADALKIEGVRITMSAYLEQTVADMLGCSLLTPRLADLVYANRSTMLVPHTQTPNASMVTSSVMIAQSASLDNSISAQPYKPGIVSTVGKHWVISNLLTTHANKAINYGWHIQGNAFAGVKWPGSVSLPGISVIQNPGWAHAAHEVDYSQNCVLVARTCYVDGVTRDLHDVLQDPVLSSLVSVEGPLKTLRQPGVSVAPFSGKTPPCAGPSCPSLVVWNPSEGLVERRDVSMGSIVGMGLLGGFLGALALGRRRF